jgi:PAS domain S-box-containing protein
MPYLETASVNAPASAPSLSALIENVPGNVYRRVRRPDGSYHFEFLSSGLFRHFGIDNERLLHQREIRFDWIHPDDRDRFLSDLELSATVLSELDHRVRVIGADGRIHWARGIARPERRADGSIVWDGIVIDVTKEIEAEAALRIAKDDAERAQALITRVVTDIAERLRPPLGELTALLATFGQDRGLGPALHAEIMRCRAVLEEVLRPFGAGLGPSADAPAGAQQPARPASLGVASLTARQGEVLQLMSQGLSNKVIAARLGITPGTVKLHAAVVLRALGVRSRRDVVPKRRTALPG